MTAKREWPEYGIWGAMPSAEYVDAPREGLDSYHLHRWLEKKNDGDPYEQWFGFFAPKEDVQEAADYLNTLEAAVDVWKHIATLAFNADFGDSWLNFQSAYQAQVKVEADASLKSGTDAPL